MRFRLGLFEGPWFQIQLLLKFCKTDKFQKNVFALERGKGMSKMKCQQMKEIRERKEKEMLLTDLGYAYSKGKNE